MNLFINKDIGNPTDMERWMFGVDEMSFTSIHDMMMWANEYYPEDKTLNVEIHSCGGDTVEGYAIYDAIRSSGMEVTCTVVGTAASMATVILLAAPKERRFAYEHARMLIHHPYYESIGGGEITTARLEAMKQKLEAESAKMIALYVERTGMEESAIREQMDRGDWFDPQRAMALGFIAGVVPATSAKGEEERDKISTTIKNRTEMKFKDEKSAGAKMFISLGKAMGFIEDDEHATGKGQEETPKSLVITDVNGNELNFDTEDTDVKVGDTTDAADGEYTLDDGRVIVVENGVVTEIREPEEETNEEVEALKAEVAELKKQLEDSKASVAEKDQLLAKMKSNYTPKSRKTEVGTKEKEEEAPKSKVRQRLEQLQAKARGEE